MKLSPVLGWVVRLVGVILLVASLAYLAMAIHASWPRLQALAHRELAGSILLAVAAYVPLLIVVALGWSGLVVNGLPGGRILRTLLSTYGTSQLAKYLPGNVFHLVGRQVLGGTQGVPQAALAAASVQEAAAMVLACGALAVAGDLAGTSHVLPLSREVMAGALVLGGVGLVVILAGRRNLGSLGRLLGPGAFLGALASHALFLLGSTAIAQGLAGPMGLELPAFGTLLAVWCWAYLAGFVTPAAPGGIGVREAVFIALLPADGNPGLALVLVMRLVSMAGDLLFAALAAGLGRNRR